jgi:formylmethanofuran dehydrogenase subunit D
LRNREASNLPAGRGSYSQHNTVVHKVGGLYCGIPHRNTLLMNRADMARAGFRAHQRVTVQGEAGELQNVEIISGEIRAGAALMFYPEVNAIFKAVIDSRSGTPAFKRVPVLVRAGRGQHDLAFPAGGAVFASEGDRAGNMASANRAE